MIYDIQCQNCGHDSSGKDRLKLELIFTEPRTLLVGEVVTNSQTKSKDKE